MSLGHICIGFGSSKITSAKNPRRGEGADDISCISFPALYYHIQETVTQMMLKCCFQYPIEIKITPLIKICAVLC